MAAMASLGLSTTMANVMANICSVKGMGPKGTTTQADTAMMAMVKPDKDHRPRSLGRLAARLR